MFVSMVENSLRRAWHGSPRTDTQRDATQRNAAQRTGARTARSLSCSYVDVVVVTAGESLARQDD